MQRSDIAQQAEKIRNALQVARDVLVELEHDFSDYSEDQARGALRRIAAALDLPLMADRPFDEDGRWSHVKNLWMRTELEHEIAIDVSPCGRTENGLYILAHFEDGKDYCDAQTGEWVQWIGRHLETGVIFACMDSRGYLHPGFDTLFLR